MKLYSQSILLLLCTWNVFGQSDNVLQIFKNEGNFVDLGLKPGNELFLISICYKDFFVAIGNFYTVESTQMAPHVDLNQLIKRGMKYTLLMVDPDAPSRANPTFKSFLHWAVTDLTLENSNFRNEVVRYLGPGPPRGSGPHRYIFLLFEQPGSVSIEGFSDSNRASFNTGDFVRQNNLGLIAGNYFFAQNV